MPTEMFLLLVIFMGILIALYDAGVARDRRLKEKMPFNCARIVSGIGCAGDILAAIVITLIAIGIAWAVWK